MEIPVHILWGVAGFLVVAVIKLGFQALKDIDAAHLKIREILEKLEKRK